MDSLLRNFSERRIWRVLVAYPSVTFIWLQAVEFFINNYALDERLLSASIIAALALFPVAVIWNWRHGEAGSQAISKPEITSYAFCSVLAIAAVSWFWSNTPATARAIEITYAPARTIAVMPFENAGDDASVQFLCDGIAESLINWLATVPDVKVISRSAAFRMRDSIDNTQAIAAALGVDGVVRGRLEQVGDQIVISTSFIDTRDDSQLWGERLTRPFSEVLYIERSIVDSIKSGLQLEVTSNSTPQSASGGTDDPKAYEHYLRGHFLVQSTNNDEIYQGLDELRASIEIDPEFALPHADIADALSQMVYYGIARDEGIMREAQSAAYSAVALAPQLPEAQIALAAVLQYIVFDWEKTDQAFEAAIALGPQSPSPYFRYADYLVFTLRFDRAREMAALALEQDALGSGSLHAVGFAALMDGDFDTAVTALGDWNRFHPSSRWSYVKHAVALSLNNDCDLAMRQAATAVDLMNGEPSTLIGSWLAWVYKNCAEEELYAAAISRIQDMSAADPDSLDPGVMYLFALEGQDEALVDYVARVVTAHDPLTPFMQLFMIDYLGWQVPTRCQTIRNIWPF
jgi:TolB-like protein